VKLQFSWRFDEASLDVYMGGLTDERDEIVTLMYFLDRHPTPVCSNDFYDTMTLGSM
jgi:hypothetical protein